MRPFNETMCVVFGQGCGDKCMCFSFNSVRYVQHAGAVLALKKRRKKEEEEEEKKKADLFSMNYFLLRFTPTATERLTRERACAIGGARQSCLIRRSHRRCRRRDEEEIQPLGRITRSLSAPAVARPPCFVLNKLTFSLLRLKKKNQTRRFVFFSSPSRQWVKEDKKTQEYSCGDEVFRGSSLSSQVIPLTCSVRGCRRWEDTFTDLSRCDSTRVFSSPPPEQWAR